MRLLFLFLVFFAPLIADDDIVVPLATQSRLVPLKYSFTATNAFDKSFVESLQKVLKFDLNNNGLTQISSQESCPYAAQFYISDGKLFVRALDHKKKLKTTIGGLPLTGELNKDRRQAHKLNDAICKILFDEEGIATCRFLYTVKNKVGIKPVAEVFEADYDGANPVQVTHEDTLCVTPAYVPPKKGYAPDSFLYVSYRNGQPKIYIASLKNGEGEKLLSLRGNQFMPVVSHLCDHVAFICDIAGNADLFVQPFDASGQALGKPRQIFTAIRGTQASPSFSPNGKKVAFVSNKDGAPRVYQMDIPASDADVKDVKPKLVSKHNKESTSPCWSPDGSKIAFSSMTAGTRQIWIYDCETQEEFQLTTGPGHKENPAWAPNSFHLMYNSANNEKAEIFLTHIYQGDGVKITNGPGEKRFASWQPIVK
ncbi:MAG: Tol-Pal system protein TolB [Parachlamydiales bacterium]|nr:Tol-Pal system protein TolB [Parachlamydiales bacterium]